MRELFAFFKEFPPSFKDNTTTKMYIEGKLYDYTQEISVDKLFPAEKILKYNLVAFHNMQKEEKLEYLKNFIEHTYRQDLIQAREKEESIRQLLERSNSAKERLNVEWVMANLTPARMLGDNRKDSFYFIDNTTNRLTRFDYHMIFLAVARAFDDKIAKSYINNFVSVAPVYEPRGEAVFKIVDEQYKIYHLNTYMPPLWRSSYDKLEAIYPPELEKFMNHLFPTEESQEFVFNWIYHSLTTRAQTYLYLQGGQGAGKNTFAQILGEMHGSENTSFPNINATKNRFNKFLENKTFIFLDEFSCRTREQKDLLKAIINDKYQMEAKGFDQVDIKIHASYLIANNSPHAVGLDPVDRRFSVPEINNENLTNTFTQKEISELHAKITDPHYIGSFAKWVLTNFENPKYEASDPYQKRHYEYLVHATTRDGFKETLDKILSQEQDIYHYADEKEAYERRSKNRYPHLVDWQKFFSDITYKHEKIGRVEGGVFIPRENLMPKNYLGKGDLL